MQLFGALYKTTMKWADHRNATKILGGLSFAESSFFPIPIDVMLLPMCLKTPSKAYQFALLTTIMSVIGGIFGYLLGYFAFDFVEPIIHNVGYWEKFERIQVEFEKWGIWIIFVAGFSPIPYKIFTISAGVLSLSFIPFVLASLVARAARFFLVAAIVKKYGTKVEPVLLKYIERIGWALVALLVLAFVIYKL
jgi:membrane protein YqaA with SNARE-associated domain